MELRQLEYFVAVAEEASFTRAAGRAHVGQSAVSVAIRTLERELGSSLFDRTTHQVALTDAGAALLPEARRTLEGANAALDAVAAVRRVVRGTLRIGTMQSLTAVDVADYLRRFHHRHPGVEIRMHPALGGSAALADEVRQGSVDLAFASLPDRDGPGLAVRLLTSEPLLLVGTHSMVVDVAGPRRRPAALAKLAGGTFIEFPPGWGTRTAVDRGFGALSLQRRPGIEVADVTTFVALVAAGIGLGLLPASMVPARRDLTTRPTEPTLTWDVMLVHSSQRRLSAAATAFVALVDEPSATTKAT